MEIIFLVKEYINAVINYWCRISSTVNYFNLRNSEQFVSEVGRSQMWMLETSILQGPFLDQEKATLKCYRFQYDQSMILAEK